MAIKLKAVEISEPGVAGGGKMKYVARAVSDGEVGLAELTERIEKICTVHGADILAVVYSLVDVAKDMMSDGKIVRIEGLGSLRISVSSKVEDSEEEVNAKSVKDAKVILTPDLKFKDMLKMLHYKRV